MGSLHWEVAASGTKNGVAWQFQRAEAGTALCGRFRVRSVGPEAFETSLINDEDSCSVLGDPRYNVLVPLQTVYSDELGVGYDFGLTHPAVAAVTGTLTDDTRVRATVVGGLYVLVFSLGSDRPMLARLRALNREGRVLLKCHMDLDTSGRDRHYFQFGGDDFC